MNSIIMQVNNFYYPIVIRFRVSISSLFFKFPNMIKDIMSPIMR